MAGAVERWRENRAALDAAALDPREVARRLDLLEHEAAEIAAARLRPGEADEIRGRLTAAQHGEAIARGAASLREALTQEGAGARDTAAVALQEARGLARLDPRFEPLAERLAGLEAELTDVADEARRLSESVDHDPRAVAELDARLGVIHGLDPPLRRRRGRGHRPRGAGLARGGTPARSRRGAGATPAGGRRAAGRGRDRGRGAVGGAPGHGGRRSGRAVGEVLEELGFPTGVFEVAVGRRPAGPGEAAVEVDGDAVAFDTTGVDQVVYRLAPNPGEPARPLARIASGGELSRVALAIKRVLAEADETPTLVFDEVDSGIGGRSADPVGRSLWGLARRHQVLCVTHLPQIAAHADAHYRIAKREREGRTVTEVERLDREGRIVELAAMLGGGPGDPASLASARELLDRAEAWRGGGAAVGSAGADRTA